jgi:hypothetical protein
MQGEQQQQVHFAKTALHAQCSTDSGAAGYALQHTVAKLCYCGFVVAEEKFQTLRV